MTLLEFINYIGFVKSTKARFLNRRIQRFFMLFGFDIDEATGNRRFCKISISVDISCRLYEAGEWTSVHSLAIKRYSSTNNLKASLGFVSEQWKWTSVLLLALMVSSISDSVNMIDCFPNMWKKLVKFGIGCIWMWCILLHVCWSILLAK